MDGNIVTGNGGNGGGALCWTVGELFEMDGWMALRGENGKGRNSGGGSGGAVLIKTLNMTGL